MKKGNRIRGAGKRSASGKFGSKQSKGKSKSKSK